MRPGPQTRGSSQPWSAAWEAPYTSPASPAVASSAEASGSGTSGCGSEGGRRRSPARSAPEGEDDVHQQAPAPADQVGEGAADDQPDDRAAAGHRAVHRERAAALPRVPEQHRDRRECRRREERGEPALQGSAGHQDPEGRGDPGQGGGSGEAAEADEQRGTPADPVGDPSTDQEQAGERQRVGGDHPLALGVAEPQVVLGGGQGDVDDGGVECGEQLSHRDDAERAPSSGEGGSSAVRGVGVVGHGFLL